MTTKTLIMYVAPAVNYREDFRAVTPFGATLPLKIDAASGVGFLTVYETEDAFRAAHPESEPLRILVEREVDNA